MEISERLKFLKPLINLSQDEFFVVRILKRKKDDPKMDLSVKQLKTYSFYSWKELEDQIDRIQEICDLNKARAYIRLNKQNSIDVSLRCISEITDNLRNGNPHKNKSVWDSVSGKLGKKDWWILDIDFEHLSVIDYRNIFNDIGEEYLKRKGELTFKERERELFHIGKYMIKENPTKSGIHLIVKPFDTRILEKYNKELSSKGIPTIQIQKDANTILYIGK